MSNTGGISGSTSLRSPEPASSLRPTGNDPGRVFVVMGNDFPDAVFATEEAAHAHCEAQRLADRKEDERNGRHIKIPRIYWRVYDFDLLTETPL